LLEILQRGSAPTEYRHQIPAGSSLAIFTRRSDNTSATYYATSDHLGSADLVLDASATVLTRESYTPFGARRGSNWQGLPTAADYTAFGNTTRRGFTGHEMLDSVSLVHMNGRVYDPYLGRFTSADTVIQNLAVTASINPFSYAWNDPLRYTDPSGHSLLDVIGAIIGIVVAIFFPEIMAFLGFHVSLTGVALAMVSGFVGGFVGALIATGSLSAALMSGVLGAVTAGLFYGVGSLADGFSWTPGTRVLAHAAVGCAQGELSGGNCGKGAAAAAVGEAATRSGFISDSGGRWGSFKAAAEAGAVGGVASAITGGKFVEGFSTAAAGYLFNAASHESAESQGDQQQGLEQPTGFEKLGKCASDQFGIGELAELAAVAAGQPIAGTKPFVTPGSSRGTSLAGKAADAIFGAKKFSRSVPTIVGGPGTGRALAIAGTRSVARFAGRAVPIVGWVLLAYDGVNIGVCALSD
jgi:RHS repeat-associated protein